MDSQHPSTPVGGSYDLGFARLTVFCDGDTVIASGFQSLDEIAAGRPYTQGDLPETVTQALAAWQDGQWEPLMTVPVRYAGTPKLAQLRRAMRTVPAGRVVTYSDLAASAGLPGLSRLAGRACSENPCLLFVPCHRIVAAGNVGPPVIAGSYAGSETVKALLLEHEGVAVRTRQRDEASGF